MTGKIYHPEDKHPEPYQSEMNPHASDGMNNHLAGTRAGKEDPPTAHDVKDAHRLLSGYNDDELKRIVILPAGTRLEQGSTYIDLRDPSRREFTARADMEATAETLYVPKTEFDYPLWNRLIGVTDPARLDRSGG